MSKSESRGDVKPGAPSPPLSTSGVVSHKSNALPASSLAQASRSTDNHKSRSESEVRWPGIEAVIEAYQRHADGKCSLIFLRGSLLYIDISISLNVRLSVECLYTVILHFLYGVAFAEQKLEKQVLMDQCQQLQHKNRELNRTAEKLSMCMSVSVDKM